MIANNEGANLHWNVVYDIGCKLQRHVEVGTSSKNIDQEDLAIIFHFCNCLSDHYTSLY